MKYVNLFFKFVFLLTFIAAITYVGPADAKDWRVFTGAWSHHFLQDTDTEIKYEDRWVEEYIYSERYNVWVPVERLRTIKRIRKPMELNENHNLLAVQYKNFMFGYFKNSFYEDSALLGYKIYHKEFFHSQFRFDLYTGVSYGYRDCFSKYSETLMKDYSEQSQKVCPLAVPMVTYTGSDLVQPYVALFGSALTVGLSWAF